MDGDPSTVNLDPYLDPVGIWTIGWGHAITHNGRFLRGSADRKLVKSLYPNGLDPKEAEGLLRQDVVEHARALDAQLTTQLLNDNQYSALVSFVFNLGPENFRKSRLRTLVNKELFAQAAREFAGWNKARVNGQLKVLNGLVRRRAAEAALFMKEG